MQVLDQRIIIKTTFLLAMLFFICAINLHFFIRRVWDKLSVLFHTASFLGLIAIFCHLMDTIIIGLPFESYFKQIRTISLILCLLIIAISIFILLLSKGNVSLHLLWAPDLKSVFASIDDLAIIIDYKGIITEINHPKRLETLLGNNLETLEELMSKLRNKTSKSSHAGLETRLLKMNCKEQFEIHFIEEAADYLFSLTPIVAGKSHLGATIVMYNITEKKNSEQQMKIFNSYLENANRKLSNYVKIASVLEAEKERLSLLKQVQRDLVYKIEMAIAHVHHIQITCYDSMLAYKKDIAKIADMLRDVYRDVRKSILSISGKERG